MTEDDYIRASSLAYLRSALRVLATVAMPDDDSRRELRRIHADLLVLAEETLAPRLAGRVEPDGTEAPQ